MNREEWLQKHERQFEFACIGISERLSDYASSDEIAAVIAALKQLWSSHGKGVRAANKAGDFNTRNSLSKERSWIRRVIATLQANRIPSDNNSEDIDAILAPILARHRAAKQNAIERIKALAWEIEFVSARSLGANHGRRVAGADLHRATVAIDSRNRSGGVAPSYEDTRSRMGGLGRQFLDPDRRNRRF